MIYRSVKSIFLLFLCLQETRSLGSYDKTLKISSKDNFPIHVSKYTDVYFDHNQQFDASEALNQPFQDAGQGPYKIPNNKTNIWLKLKLHNSENQPLRVKLSTSAIYNRQFSVFEISEEGLKHVGTPFLFYRPVIDLVIEPGTHSFLILLTNYNNFYELNLDSEQSLWITGSFSLVFLGISIGVMLVIIYTTTSIWRGLKEKSVFYYMAYVHCIVATSTINSGFIRYFLDGEALVWGTYVFGPFIGCLMVFSLSKTLCHLTDVKSSSRVLFYILEVFSYLFLAFSIVSLILDHPKINLIIRVFLTLFLLTGLISLLVPRQEKAQGHTILTLGWLAMLTSSILYLLTIENVIPRFLFSNYLFLIGSCIQMICFSSVMLNRQRTLVKNHADARYQLELKTVEAKKNEELMKIEKDRGEALTSLIHVFSHDLRNPLSSVIGFTELLLEDLIAEDERIDIYKKIHKSANTMEGIIKMVNTQEAIRLNIRNLSVAEVKLKKCIDDTLEIFQSKLESKNINCVIIGLETLDSGIVMADPTALSICVFSNVVSNAIKFSPNGSTITWTISQLEPSTILVSIEDQGVGISQEEIEKVNHGGSLKSKKGTSGEAGTGFGIQQIQRFMNLMGGRVTVGQNLNSTDPMYPGLVVNIYLKGSVQENHDAA